MPEMPEATNFSTREVQAPKWYRRRSAKISIAALATAGFVVASFAVVGSANADTDRHPTSSTVVQSPQDAVAQAFSHLKGLPAAVTITTTGDKAATVNLVATDKGAQVSVDSSDASFRVALIDEHLYLQVGKESIKGLGVGPYAGMLAGFPSLATLLDGGLVSLDVSPGSPLLTALADQQGTTAADRDAMKSASEDLRSAMTAIAQDLREPVRKAMTEHVTVTEAAPTSDGSQHFHVALDVAGARSDLKPALHQGLEDFLAALDSLPDDLGAGLPMGGAKSGDLRADLEKKFADAMAKEVSVREAEVYLTDGELTRIVTQNATFDFDPTPALDDVSGAASMDQDLLRLLPLLKGLNLAGMHADANSSALAGLGL